MEKTFAMIKPHAVASGDSGAIINLIEKNGFSILKMEKLHLSQDQAREFYAVHKDRPFYNDLVAGMTTGPVIVMALEKDGAIKAWRDLMGATNPAEAAIGSLRAMYGANIQDNATHGSDAPQTAQQEVAFFFPEL